MNVDVFMIANSDWEPYPDIREMQRPRLLDIVMHFDAQGYDGFFIGTKRLIPITCQYWRDEYEIGNTPRETLFGTVWIWADVAFLRRGDLALGRTLRSQGLKFSRR